MSITTVGIIGAGTMGNGIAQACAVSGINVVMVDISTAAVDKGVAAVSSSLDRLLKKEKITAADKATAMARIKGSSSYDDLVGAQLIIEAATENYDLKVKILKQIDTLVAPEVIIASNTSSISITRLAAVTKRPDKVVGMHFFNPAPVMKLIEIVRGYLTSEETIGIARSIAAAMGKETILAKDYPGFLSTRIGMPLINEGILALYQGLGSVEDIDKANRLGLNHPMGPLELADLVGLDTILNVLEILYEGHGEQKYFPCPLLRQMVEAGHLGRKTGRGFYDYSGKEKKPAL